MSSIGLGRTLVGSGGSLSIRGIGQRKSRNGRQGKSAASGRAHMVGRLKFQRPLTRRAGWRFEPKLKRFQHADRRRCQPEPPSRP